MKLHIFIIYLTVILAVASCGKGERGSAEQWTLRTSDGLPPRTVSIDTMEMRNPFIYLDKENLTYYMTGDGGNVWTSRNMRTWQGPYNVLKLDSTVWMGTAPVITSPEIHRYKGKYYYLATFTRHDVTIDRVADMDIPRQSCQLLVADSVQGPYKPIPAEFPLLRADQASIGATFITDEYDTGYIIYSHNCIQNGDGTIQIIMLTDDCATQIGEPYIMLQASQNSWSRRGGDDTATFSPVMDGSFLFDTEGRELGLLFSTCIGEIPALGVAYSEKDHGLNGPWHIEPAPLLTGGYGQAMLFNDFDGTLVMVLHEEVTKNGVTHHRPRLFEMDSQYDKLIIKGNYNF